MKIAVLIPLILEINNSVDFLNLIPNVQEHNLEFEEELNIVMLTNLYQYIYGNTVGLELGLDELVAELVEGNSQLVELVGGNSQLVQIVKYILKMYLKFFCWVTLQFKFQA